MSDEQKSHFWIPDEEVQRVNKTLRAMPTKRNVSFSEHGSKLSHSLQVIKQTLEAAAPDNSLADSDLLVFNIELPHGEKIQDKQSLFDSNGMKVRAVKNVRSAIVTSTSSQFQTLRNRVDAYTRNGSGRTYFDFIEDFKPYIGSEKNSSELRKLTASAQVPVTLDIQLMLIPNLENHLYHSALTQLIEKINETRGHVQESPYYLSDNTPVVRAIIPSNTLTRFENDSAIYRIEKTDFFNVETTQEAPVDLGELELDPSVNLEELPIVAVLDSGVMFPESLSSLIIKNWVAPNSSGGDSDHGTKVASRVAFKYINQQLSSSIITPRTRILDCNILDGNVPVNIFIQRIQAAVNAHSDIVKIYNLSANASSPIEGDEMSIIGYELDALQSRTGVQFFVSAGNHKLWQTEFGLEDVLDDDDSRISAPADSMLSVVVGSIVGADHQNSLSQRNQIAPYSRRGPGFQGFSKPDLSAYAGTIILDGSDASVPNDPFSMVMTKNGMLIADAGTSFSAPIVAGDFAEILNTIPDRDTLLSKALLYHNAVALWDVDGMEEEELAFAHNLYGRGISNVDDSKYSSPSKVTFVRTGTLNRTTMERVTIYMPPILAAQVGRNVAKVSVTCVSRPSVDRTKGTEYLGAYIRASLKKSHVDGVTLKHVQQDFKEGRQKWDVCHQFSKPFSRFNAGDWQVWLELFSRWEAKNEDVPYALVVTIEDMSGSLDVYSEIEALNRYRALNTIRLRVDN
ncbi:S8 family peptidase [Paenibacillus hamazuiensis]|uniref:S8 family peptidase n=1 Tax=Paenibacillus hamazuiensis TaxID=2936508 RepID=UPI00200CABD3|nr:S8 family peptidase [Paenibacillus hamazuiensis]